MLLFTDTNSLTYQNQTVNLYKDFYADKQLFDFSGYEKESPVYNDSNKKVIGKMKDELNGEIIENFCRFENKNVFIASKERRNEEGKGSEEERSRKIH